MSANPLLEHPVLQHMPYTLIHNPSIEGIKSYLKKRSKNMKVFKYIALVIVLLNLIMIVLGIFTSFEDYFIPIVMLFLGGWAHVQQKKCIMTDNEIEFLIQPKDSNDG